MKIVVFQGGLGNQIFQYAVYEYIKKYICNKVRYIFVGNSHNGMEIDQFFEVDIIKAHKCVELLYRYCHLLAKKGLNPFISLEDDVKPFRKVFIEGYWQDKKYFTPGFVCFKKLSLSSRNSLLLSRIQKENSVTIHVRRGDYLLPHFHHIYGNVCTIDYYNKAKNYILDRIPSPSFFIFSDDMLWVKENLVIEDATYVDWNTKDDSVIDMFLMSHAKANVIANSSFSFWGACLNKNSSIVIYPKKWYNGILEAPNIFPNSWIGL